MCTLITSGTRRKSPRPKQALDVLQQAGVERAVVIGIPADLALKLKQLAPERIVLLYGP